MLSKSYDYQGNHYRFVRVSEVPVEIESVGKMKSWIPNWLVNWFL